jgi:hypothetical protein
MGMSLAIGIPPQIQVLDFDSKQAILKVPTAVITGQLKIAITDAGLSQSISLKLGLANICGITAP